MSFRYIGSKARVVDTIIDRIGSPDSGMFIDAFSGTGAVAETASRAGWKVHVNDHLRSSAIMSFARLVSKADVLFSGLGGYASAVEVLNSLKPQRGFIWREYSPASSQHCSVSRMYFTEGNAQKIDAIRSQIREWRSREDINQSEERVLIADLALLWQICGFWDSPDAECVIHGEPAFDGGWRWIRIGRAISSVGLSRF